MAHLLNLGSPAVDAAMRDYYDDGFKLLLQYREAGISNIPIAEWFKARIKDPETYDFWAKWKFKRTDLSDEYYLSLKEKEREEFVAQQFHRLRVGLWEDTPAFKRMTLQQQRLLRKINPLAGRVQMLTGAHYFLLNIPETLNGNIVQTYERKSAQLHDVCDILMGYRVPEGQNRQGLIVPKPRSVRFTTNYEGMLVRLLRISTDMKAFVTIDNLKKVPSISEDMEEMYNRAPEWFKAFFQNEKGRKQELFSATKNEGLSEVKLNYCDEKTKKVDKKRHCSILIAGAKPKALEKFRGIFMVADEIGKYEYPPTDTIRNSGACLLGNESTKRGFHLVGGTSDYNNKFVREYETIFNNAKLYDFIPFFIGRQHYKYFAADGTGWTDEERVISEERQKRKEAVASGQFRLINGMRCQDPIEPSDCFLTEGLLGIDDLMLETQKAKIRELRTNPETRDQVTITKGHFIFPNPRDIPVFVPGEGGWQILEHPSARAQNTRWVMRDSISGSDNVDMDIDPKRNIAVRINRLSMSAMVILNAHSGKPVAIYWDRHHETQTDYIQKIAGCMYYNCRVLIEKNRPAELKFFLTNCHLYPPFDLYPDKYFSRYCEHTPDKTGDYSHSERYGIDTSRSKAIFFESYLLEYMKECIGLIFFEDLLNELKGWKATDEDAPDLGMALLVAVIAWFEIRGAKRSKGRSIDVMAMSNAYAQVSAELYG